MSQQTKLKLKPVGFRVVVKREEKDEEVVGGIIVPDSAKKKPETATVVAIGSPKKDKDGETAIPVKVGDTILMDKYSGQDVSVDDEDFVILKADDIIAIVE